MFFIFFMVGGGETEEEVIQVLLDLLIIIEFDQEVLNGRLSSIIQLIERYSIRGKEYLTFTRFGL